MLFGVLAGLLWPVVFWPLLFLIVVIELFFWSKSASDERFSIGGLLACGLVFTATLHLFGLLNVHSAAIELITKTPDWPAAAYALARYFIPAIVYPFLKGGVKTVYYNRVELPEKLRIEIERWATYEKDKESDDYKRRRDEKLGQLYDQFRIDVRKHYWQMARWGLLWPLDMIWELLFRWFRIEELLILIFKMARRPMQWFVDTTGRNAIDAVKAELDERRQ